MERDELLSQPVAKLPFAHVGETMVVHPLVPQLPDDHPVQPDTVAASVASPVTSVPSHSSPLDASIMQLALASATHAMNAVASDRICMFFISPSICCCGCDAFQRIVRFNGCGLSALRKKGG
ncbi:hypothetical protein [Sorangium sp. So ce854]|uniref:hypothetical protein n=1 Tax=Sorangium sp. So ce854 TaxID=3133322 RepID=UPI003F612DC4